MVEKRKNQSGDLGRIEHKIEHFEDKIKEKLENYILDHKRIYGFDIRNKFLHLFWHLDKPWNEKMAQSFKTFTNQIDLLRDEKTIDIIPELREILE